MKRKITELFRMVYAICVCLRIVMSNTFGCVCCFVFLRLVSCVWWCSTHTGIVLVFCFACLCSVSYVPNIVSLFGLSILDCPFGFSYVYLNAMIFINFGILFLIQKILSLEINNRFKTWAYI